MRVWMFIATPAALALVGAAGWWALSITPDAAFDEAIPVMPASVDVAQGEALYAENCAACHGTHLEGQPDWRSPGPDGVLPAPPHDKTGHTWHHPDGVLFQYTTIGGQAALALQGVDFNSGMPGFGEILTDQEIWNILAYIRSTWPARARTVQAERTAADLAIGAN